LATPASCPINAVIAAPVNRRNRRRRPWPAPRRNGYSVMTEGGIAERSESRNQTKE
jgi:hypothetical protein